MDGRTSRNHYNPCFWTALWNPEYFEAWQKGDAPQGTARDQVVFTLNLRANKVLRTRMSRVHYEKGLGIAEISPESMKAFCRRWFPSELPGLSEYLRNHPESLFLDFEETLGGIEQLPSYTSLLDAARVGGITSVEHKGFLTCLLVMHVVRSHEFMTDMIETSAIRGIDKWEYFWLLRHALANRLVLARAVTPLAMGQWTLYSTSEHRFPLPDSPVMVRRDTLMVVLSPRLLLEINLNVARPEDCWVVRDGISSSKYREFRRRAIGNAFTDIIFHDRATLETWRQLPECKRQVAALARSESRQDLIHAAAARVIWALDGFGRVPPDFETWIDKYCLS